MATLYYVVYPAAASAPSAAQVKAGQQQSGAAATASGSETARTTTGEQIFASAAAGLSPGTSYRVAFVWSDGSNDSTVAVSDAWTTAAPMMLRPITGPLVRPLTRRVTEPGGGGGGGQTNTAQQLDIARLLGG